MGLVASIKWCLITSLLADVNVSSSVSACLGRRMHPSQQIVLVSECNLVIKSRQEAARRRMDGGAVDGPARHGWMVMCGRKQQQAGEDEGIDMMRTGARASADKGTASRRNA